MRFRGILQIEDTQSLEIQLDDAQQSDIYAVQRFARTLRRDITAVRNALTERWSNGQTEGQIKRLKTLKRGMYGRASICPEIAALPAHRSHRLRKTYPD